MDIISKQANYFVENYIMNGLDHKDILKSAREKVSEIDNQLDKIKFLNIILEGNNKEYEKHLPGCRDLENCSTNFGHETVQYFLTQELSRLGVDFIDDTFSEMKNRKLTPRLKKFFPR